MTAASAPMAMETKQRPWWLTLIGGIAALVIGAILLWAPDKSTQANTYLLLIEFLGIYWLVSGILDLVSMFVDHTAWGWKLFMGVVSIMAGSYILMYPKASALALPHIFVLVLGVWGLIQGCILLALAFKGGGWGAGILGGLGILFGLILIANYSMVGMGITMIWTAAWAGVLGGLAMIYIAFQQRKAGAA